MSKKTFIFYITVVVIFISSMIASINGVIDLATIFSIYIGLLGILICKSLYNLYKSSSKYHD